MALSSVEEAPTLLLSLLEHLPRPRAATSARLEELIDPCVTIKLGDRNFITVESGI
jgi:hypothetical protein